MDEDTATDYKSQKWTEKELGERFLLFPGPKKKSWFTDSDSHVFSRGARLFELIKLMLLTGFSAIK